MLSRGVSTFPRVLTRLASSQYLAVADKGPGSSVIETSSGVKACLMESQVNNGVQ